MVCVSNVIQKCRKYIGLIISPILCIKNCLSARRKRSNQQSEERKNALYAGPIVLLTKEEKEALMETLAQRGSVIGRVVSEVPQENKEGEEYPGKFYYHLKRTFPTSIYTSRFWRKIVWLSIKTQNHIDILNIEKFEI